MNNRWKLAFKSAFNSLSTKKFKFVFLLLICLNIFSILGLALNKDYLTALFTIYSTTFYNLGFLVLTFYNAILVVETFDKNTNYIIRFKNKKEYLSQLFKNVIALEILVIGINFIIVIIGINFTVTQFEISNWFDYKISNLIYIVFYLLRYFAIFLILSILNTIIIKTFNSISALCFNLITWALYIFGNYSFDSITSLGAIKLAMHDYLLYYSYSSFSLEIFCSVIYVVSLIILCSILYLFIIKHKIKVGEK